MNKEECIAIGAVVVMLVVITFVLVAPPFTGVDNITVNYDVYGSHIDYNYSDFPVIDDDQYFEYDYILHTEHDGIIHNYGVY